MPFEISEKLDKKLKEATTSVIASPVQLEKKSNTNGNPLTVKKKHTVTETIKAITWFFVNEEINIPIDK